MPAVQGLPAAREPEPAAQDRRDRPAPRLDLVPGQASVAVGIERQGPGDIDECDIESAGDLVPSPAFSMR